MNLSKIQPYARVVRLWWRKRHANWLANRPCRGDAAERMTGMAFVIGCGRSGTTVLGRILERHPRVSFLFEPWHLWAAVDPHSDMIGLYYAGDGLFFMGAEHHSAKAQRRFNRLIIRARQAGKLVLEKSPHNVARIGFLESLTSGSRYVHVVRNGLDVSSSIGGLATVNSYRIAGRTQHNQWWGRDDCKWRTLAQQGAAGGYFPQEIGLLRTHAQRGAYEWLVSLGEADRWRVSLGPRFYELTYSEITSDPVAVLRALCAFLGLDSPDRWLQLALEVIRPERHHGGPPLELPPAMCEQFNQYQARFGFAGRAVCLGT